jgi:integrase
MPKKRADDRYQRSFRLADGTRKYVYGKTRAEVDRRLEEAKRKAEAGQLVRTDRQRVAEYLEYWLSIHKLTIREITETVYASEIRARIVPALGAIPLQRLTQTQIQHFVRDLVNAGLAPSTVRGIYKILNKALNDAVEWKSIPFNPCQGVKLPREEQEEVQALDAEEAQMLLDAVRGTNLAGIVPLALATGLRRGELLALHWSDIDWERGVLRVQRTLVYVNGKGYQETEPKTRSSRRSVVVAPFALEALREWRKAQLSVAPQAAVWQDNNLIFPNAKGVHLHPATLNYRFRRLIAKVEHDPMRFHALRHSCATLLLRMRVPGKVVQEILGHSSIRTTMDKYGHVLPGMQDEAIHDLDRLLSPDGQNYEAK